jgi:ubiquinone biosynthesis protein UbiJ
LAALIQASLNACINLDQESKMMLQTLAGQVVCLHFRDINGNIFLFIHADTIEVMSEFDGDIDTTISGSMFDFVKMTKGQGGVFSSDLDIAGNLNTGKKIKRYIDALEIDWEEHLAQITGDAIAHQFGNVIRGLITTSTHHKKALQDNISEYLTEESELIIEKTELAHFINDVDEQRAAADRLEAKIARLEKYLELKL